MIHIVRVVWLFSIVLAVSLTVTGVRAGSTSTRIDNSDGGYHCKWSPDGKHIVFASRRTGEAKMYLVPVDGGEPVLIESGLIGDHHIGWSPDSKCLVFDAYGPNGPPPRLWRISVTSGEVKRLVPEVIPAFQPAMSPDGEWVAFAAMQNGNSDIWKAKSDGDSLTQITRDFADDHHPQWSGDGRVIVFASNRSGNWDVWIANSDGTRERQITTAPELDDQPTLSPDGKLIAFMSERTGKRDIWLIPVDGGPARRFTHDGTNAWPSFSPDGKRLVWSSASGERSGLSIGSVAED